MKKVRYVVAAVGMAPTLGLMMPAASAATGPAQTAKGAATVELVKKVSMRPLVSCYGTYGTFAHQGLMNGGIYHSGTCIQFQSAILSKVQTGLTERVRYYSRGGYREAQVYLGGHINHSLGITTWGSSFSNYAYEVCQALVANSNHNNVKYGPVCEFA